MNDRTLGHAELSRELSVKVEVAVLGSQSALTVCTVRTVSVDREQH